MMKRTMMALAVLGMAATVMAAPVTPVADTEAPSRLPAATVGEPQVIERTSVTPPTASEPAVPVDASQASAEQAGTVSLPQEYLPQNQASDVAPVQK